MNFRNIIPLMRLNFISILVLPQVLGLVLATGKIWPFGMPGLWSRWVLAVLSLILTAGATYLLNDVVDLEDDRTNPRRQNSPLVRGLVGRREAVGWVVGIQGVALLLAIYISWEFCLTILVLSALTTIYSVPPFRCKARAGWDLLFQAGAMGLLIPLSGWVIVRPFAGTPWWFYLHQTLAWASPLCLVMLYDLPTDRARGIRTTAVCLGSRRMVGLSLLLLAISLGMLVVFAATGYLITPRFLLYVFPVAVFLLLFLPRAWWLRDDPPRLKRFIYAIMGLGSLPYLIWILYLGGIL